MRRQTWIFMMMISMAASSSAFGDHSKKLYVSLDRIVFDTSGIYVEDNECYYEVDAIVFDKDESRYYVLKKEAKWKCGNCGKYNDSKNNNCWYCGWPWGPP